MPYTAGLLGSVPRLDAPQGARLVPIPGAPPSLAALPPGCPFAPRCPLAVDDCRAAEPELLEVGDPTTGLPASAPDEVAGRSRGARSTACPPNRPPQQHDLRRAGGAAGTRSGQDVQADQGRGVPQAGRRGARRRRRQLRAAAGPHAGHRRRIGVGQVHHAAPGPGTDRPAVRFDRGARHRRRDARPRGPGGRCAATCRWCSRIRSPHWTLGCRCSKYWQNH